jgi:hypothetical protein
MRAVVRPLGLIALILLTGCSSAGDPTGSTTKPSPAAGAEPLATYHEGPPKPVSPGTYVTGREGFFPGLQLSIPPGWTTTEADAGEIGLHPAADPDAAVFLWWDMRAVVTNNRHHRVGAVREDIGPEADQLLSWLTTTSDFSIISEPVAATVGDSIHGTQLTLGVSDTANFDWDDCPDNPRCAAILTDPQRWGVNFWAIGGDETARVFIATVPGADGDHTFFVTLDAPDQDELEKLAEEATPIIESLRLPSDLAAG